MPRLDAVRAHPVFTRCLAQIGEAEADRVFCRHGLAHLLDVARIAWIRVLEDDLPLPRDVVYAAALLHDIGRAAQYATGEPHDIAGERIAAEILGTVGDGSRFTGDERAAILAAVRAHRGHGGEGPSAAGGAPHGPFAALPALIAWADHASRACWACPAAAACYWPDERRNLDLRI